MYTQLVQYKDANDGSIEIPDMAEGKGDDPGAKQLEALRRWIDAQARYRRRWTQGHATAGNLTTERVERLREAGLRAPSYDEMYARLAARRARTGTPDPDEGDDEELRAWAKEQRRLLARRLRGGPAVLSDDRVRDLGSLGLGLDLTPFLDKVAWERRMRSLREFVSEHGHCKPRKRHPLASFVGSIRHSHREWEDGKATCLTDERVNDLVEVGFVFKARISPNIPAKVRKTWEERFQHLVAFKEENGHTLVPQLSGPLGVWVKEQRTGYRRMKAGEKTSMTAEKASKMTEIGFHFDAARFKGGNSHELHKDP